MFKVEIVCYNFDTNSNFSTYSQVATVKQAKKQAIYDLWKGCQQGIFPKAIFNAGKHSIAVSGNRGVWCRFRDDSYQVTIGIDNIEETNDSAKRQFLAG